MSGDENHVFDCCITVVTSVGDLGKVALGSHESFSLILTCLPANAIVELISLVINMRIVDVGALYRTVHG